MLLLLSTLLSCRCIFEAVILHRRIDPLLHAIVPVKFLSSSRAATRIHHHGHLDDAFLPAFVDIIHLGRLQTKYHSSIISEPRHLPLPVLILPIDLMFVVKTVLRR